MVGLGAGFHSSMTFSGLGKLSFQSSCSISLATFAAEGFLHVKRGELALCMKCATKNKLALCPA